MAKLIAKAHTYMNAKVALSLKGVADPCPGMKLTGKFEAARQENSHC